MFGYGMMGWGFNPFFLVFGFVYNLLIVAILVLIAVWLFQQIQKGGIK